MRMGRKHLNLYNTTATRRHWMMLIVWLSCWCLITVNSFLSEKQNSLATYQTFIRSPTRIQTDTNPSFLQGNWQVGGLLRRHIWLLAIMIQQIYLSITNKCTPYVLDSVFLIKRDRLLDFMNILDKKKRWYKLEMKITNK